MHTLTVLWCVLGILAVKSSADVAVSGLRERHWIKQEEDDVRSLSDGLMKIESASVDEDHALDGGVHPRRQLLQERGHRGTRDCVLAEKARERFYDASTRTWTLNSELLELFEGEVQRLIDCVGDSQTIRLTRGIAVESVSAVRIERPISIIGEGSGEGQAPRWTCRSEGETDQIATISNAEHVIFHGIQFVHCNASQYLSPIVVEKSNVSFSDCRFENNFGYTGGVISSHESNLTFEHCIFRQNRAEEDGGCINAQHSSILVVRDSVFEDNGSGEAGGALSLTDKTSASITNCSFVQNDARFGGAIHTSAAGQSSRLEVEDSTFDNNRAEMEGGCLYLSGTSSAIKTSSFTNNRAALGGSIYAHRPKESSSSQSAVLHASSCTWRDNKAEYGGGAVYADIAPADEGANGTHIGRTLSIRGGLCMGNSAPYGGCIYALHDIRLEASDFNISENSASENGGGIYARKVNTVSLENIKLFVNFAQVNSMALVINTNWSTSAERFLELLDVIGAISAETTELSAA